MKTISFVILVGLCCACKQKMDFNPDTHLTPTEKDAVLTQIIRYTAKLPKKSTDSLKFDSKFDEHYLEQISRHTFTHYYIAPTGDHFFMLKRKAPSLYEKYVATGGRMRFNEADSLVEYEEVFRTWKMVPDTLARRSSFLFSKMVNGEALEGYQTKNSGGVEYIEFPDDNVYFDKPSRRWKSKQFGSVEEMVFQ